MHKLLLLLLLFFACNTFAQHKKPLDHSVYDGWKAIGERLISNDGKYVLYTVNPQEGDGELVVTMTSAAFKQVIPRGYNGVFTEDNHYLICRIKPFFQDTRQAKIKKKKPDEMPKDSLAILDLYKDKLIKLPRVKGYKTPEKGFGWLAYQKEKALPDSMKKAKNGIVDSAKIKIDGLVKLADSIIRKSIDSVKGKINREELIGTLQKAEREIIKKGTDELTALTDLIQDADGDETANAAGSEGTDLVLLKLGDTLERTFKFSSDYYFDKRGTKLVIRTTKNSKDSLSKALVLICDLTSNHVDTVMKGFNECRNFVFDEDGSQLVFVAERDSSTKALQKFYKLWYYSKVGDSARLLADKNAIGMHLGYTVSENAGVRFSRDGRKLFFGVAPIRPPKDTTLVDFELARLDVWHYHDDYLQPQQLKQLDNELKKSYMAVIRPGEDRVLQLGADDAEHITLVDEGNADWVLAESSKGNRVESQWTGREKTSAYIISTIDGKRRLVKSNSLANFEASPNGKYVYWYDPVVKHYFTYTVSNAIERNVSGEIKVSLADEENDVPDLPNAYGLMGWQGGDSAIYVYDRYDIWKVDPMGKNNAINISRTGRANKLRIRYQQTDPEKRFLRQGDPIYFRLFDEKDKSAGISVGVLEDSLYLQKITRGTFVFGQMVKAKFKHDLIYTVENYAHAPNLYYNHLTPNAVWEVSALTEINPQQQEFNWGTAELFSWKAYTGKQSTGIVYKPEDFDPKKKYPMICYFYEKLTDGLNSYIPPAPTASRLNISFYVSRGYVVFAPDIAYRTGQPGQDAYDHIVSGVRALVKQGFVDSNRIGIQGQSWGGYQVAYLITATHLFAAAWAGAPVANMTSAYGGIRWESGLNRQFQYEKTQSRIGASLWEKPELYIRNSPLFALPKVKTPLVIMSNDADGAVPWYQGIELFTGLRRLGKPVWLLQYNGEAHNLVERRNRKDIQIREQQFFDWILKGEKPAKWLIDGVPATEKGIDWGLKVE